MSRLTAPFIAITLLALVAATAATAARSDRDRGVTHAQTDVCPPSAKPDNGNGNAAGNGNAGGNGNGQGNSNAGGNGNGNGEANGNAGGNRTDQGSGSSEDCVTVPAEPAPDAVAGDGTLPPAEVGKTVNVEPVDGVVNVKEPGSDTFTPLAASAHLPEGSVLDTRAGTVELTTGDAVNGQQTAAFTGAKFQVRQRNAKAATELVLRGGDFQGCPRLDHGRRAQAIRQGFIAARGGKRRGLWGNGRGRFRTRGRWGSATVRGTVWQVEDRCDGTLTTVARGVVSVRDFGRHRTVTVRAGKRYFARVRR
jgi:hypothetical protein